jgi:hypothetical protein
VADAEGKVKRLERETQKKVSRSIAKIEVALAEWESAKEKPTKLKKRISRLKKTHRLLRKWEQESLKGKKDVVSVVGRLRKFTEICRQLDIKKTG